MNMNEALCETRYCPHCGLEVTCRSESGVSVTYFIGNRPVSSCPECLVTFEGSSIPERTRPSQRKQSQADHLNKAQLVEALYRSSEEFTSKAMAQRSLEAVAEVISSHLSRGEDIRWSDLGIFKIQERSERTGRNPQTGEEIVIPAKKVIRFKPSKGLEEKLNS